MNHESPSPESESFDHPHGKENPTARDHLRKYLFEIAQADGRIEELADLVPEEKRAEARKHLSAAYDLLKLYQYEQ